MATLKNSDVGSL